MTAKELIDVLATVPPETAVSCCGTDLAIVAHNATEGYVVLDDDNEPFTAAGGFQALYGFLNDDDDCGLIPDDQGRATAVAEKVKEALAGQMTSAAATVLNYYLGQLSEGQEGPGDVIAAMLALRWPTRTFACVSDVGSLLTLEDFVDVNSGGTADDAFRREMYWRGK